MCHSRSPCSKSSHLIIQSKQFLLNGTEPWSFGVGSMTALSTISQPLPTILYSNMDATKKFEQQLLYVLLRFRLDQPTLSCSHYMLRYLSIGIVRKICYAYVLPTPLCLFHAKNHILTKADTKASSAMLKISASHQSNNNNNERGSNYL